MCVCDYLLLCVLCGFESVAGVPILVLVCDFVLVWFALFCNGLVCCVCVACAYVYVCMCCVVDVFL